MTPESRKHRLAFAGTPAFALPSLDAVDGLSGVELVACLTRPDEPVGRKQTLTPPPVKPWAIAHGVPVLQPARLRDSDFEETFRALNLDAVALVAYGKIIPGPLLAVPRLGWINVHASLLPRWRGASPIVHAILAGDAETGVTIMRLEPTVDTGPILAQVRVPIESNETTPTLGAKLASAGAKLLAETLPRYLRGTIQPRLQPEEGISYAPKLSKTDGQLNWRESAAAVDRRVRALNPWPGTWTMFRGRVLKILRGRAERQAGKSGEPGRVAVTGSELIVECGEGAYRIEELQRQDHKALPAAAFLRGQRGMVDAVLGGEARRAQS